MKKLENLVLSKLKQYGIFLECIEEGWDFLLFKSEGFIIKCDENENLYSLDYELSEIEKIEDLDSFLINFI